MPYRLGLKLFNTLKLLSKADDAVVELAHGGFLTKQIIMFRREEKRGDISMMLMCSAGDTIGCDRRASELSNAPLHST